MTDLRQEAAYNWSEIRDQEYDFDARLHKIEEIEAVTSADVKNLFNKIFLTNVRRLNVKVTSKVAKEAD